MPVKFRDYYETLGVPKTANADDLRKAFRKLARRYHPDVAKDKKGAEEKFKEINEAYEVLSDPEKRRKYDELGADWQQYERAGAGGGGGNPFPGGNNPFFRTRPGRGGGGGNPNVREYEFDGSTGFSDFFEQFFGGAATARGRAGGFGFPPESAEAARGQDTEADLMVTLEEAINGARRVVTLRRGDKTETIDVKIPAGVHEAQRIRLRGRGEAGGDLYLRVRLAKHPDFRVEENGDVHHELTLTAPEAVLGAEKTVPTLEGGRAKLKIPAGSQPDQRFRLRGKGMPAPGGARGDLYVGLEVELPRELTEEQRALWEKLRG